MKKQIENIKGNLEKDEKVCSFYASDYHFEMITLPYIKSELKNSNKVIILSENNLCNSVKNILDRTNMNEEEKNNIYNIGWNDKKDIKLELLEKEKCDSMSIFIKGGTEYIKKMETCIRSNSDFSNVKTIHCYNINDVQKDIRNIKNNYNVILNMSGKYKF